MRSEQRVRLKRSLDTLRGKRDVVVIDTPPSLDFLMVSTLVAADWFIIPVFPSGYDLKGLELLMRTVSKVRERYNPGLMLAGVLLGNYDRTATLDRQIHEMLKKRFGDGVVFNTTIGRSVRMRDATVRGQTIFELPESASAKSAVSHADSRDAEPGLKKERPDAQSASGRASLWEGSKWLSQRGACPMILFSTCRTKSRSLSATSLMKSRQRQSSESCKKPRIRRH